MRLIAVIVCCLIAISCGSDGAWTGTVLVDDVDAVSLARAPDGGVLYITRDGEVVDVDAGVVHRVEVTTEGQRGLLGVATLDGRVFIAYTRPDTTLVVDEITDPAASIRVWNGVETPGGGLGGRLAVFGGDLLLGLGNGADTESFGQRGGALVSLNPDGPADQTPEVLSGGWNNPFAFTVTPSGDLWVADNEPGDDFERLARGDGVEVSIELPKVTAPSGLAAVSDTELFLCSYTTGRLDRYRIDDEGVPDRAGTVADDCAFDVLELGDGRIVYLTERSLRVLSRS